MRNKRKFKQTEIGMIPEDWEVKEIGEVAQVVGGGTPSTKILEFWDGDIAWITPRDLSVFKFRYIKRGERNITKKGLENSSAKLLPKGTVLLTTRAPVGYLAIADNEVTTNQGFRSLVPNNRTISEFLYYLLKKNVKILKSNASGTTFGELSGSRLKVLKFAFPVIKEQRAIAHILGTLDDKIQLNHQMNKILEKIAQAIFKHWFIDFEFPNEEGKPYKSSGGEMVDSELGEIPKGWRVEIINNVIKTYGGTTPSTKEPACWVNGKIHWATPKDLSKLDSVILLETERKITKDGLARISSGLLPVGTLLLSSRAPIGYLAISKVPISINQGFIAMVCDGPLSNYYMLNWARINMDTIKGVSGGTTFQEVNKRNFRQLRIWVPPKSIIERFDKEVEPLYEYIENNLRENVLLTQIRDALLPKLISGQIRVTTEGGHEK
ncbi:MAG: restriction endonuclease subunit S [Deltaproteobacteria bacterium]|nr:restriction endonuclease subunit S [Deltaproteobacteria bacterium]